MTSISHSKKRRHHPTESVDTNLRKKKEERHEKPTESAIPQDVYPSPSQNPIPESHSDKGKSRALDHPSEFLTVNASLVLSVPPIFASDLRAGVKEMLDSMVMRYIPSLQGVLLVHSNIRFLSQNASIRGDCPFAVCNVSFDATVWAPRVSMKLVGRINLCSPDHVSLLVHRTFNVSIARHHIPQDQWLFEYGPAENDPEFGEGRGLDVGGQSKDVNDEEGEREVNDPGGSMMARGGTPEAVSSGHWVHHLTGWKLGDPDGYIEFTVIGLTVANEMLSLRGSIQPDPFSPEHVPRPDKIPSSSLARDEISDVEMRIEYSEEEEEEEGSDEDVFKHLAKLTDEAKAYQKAERAKESVERLEKARKRKRQKSSSGVDGEGTRHGKATKRKRTKEGTA